MLFRKISGIIWNISWINGINIIDRISKIDRIDIIIKIDKIIKINGITKRVLIKLSICPADGTNPF